MHSDMLSQDDMTVLAQRRDTIEAVIAQHLIGRHQSGVGADEKSAARLLFDVLLAGLTDRTSPVDHMAVRRHASRFGDALSPVLRDVLGPDVPDGFIARCVDRYWATVLAAAA